MQYFKKNIGNLLTFFFLPVTFTVGGQIRKQTLTYHSRISCQSFIGNSGSLWLSMFPAISFAQEIDKEVLIFLFKSSLTGTTVENSYFIYKLKTANICKCYSYLHYM